MCHGNKNDCALVLKTMAKGVGKSTLPQMLEKHILGPKLCLETGSEPIKSRFNSLLGGKICVSFEELECFSQSEWSAIDSILKRQITSDSIVLQAKGQDAYISRNLNNYMLLSNFDVYDSDRRMFVLDVQTKYKGNREYWSNLYKQCFNDEVGKALYSFFYEIDLTNYHPQDFPITENKINSISKRLPISYQFIKEEYILKNKDIKSTLSDFYDEFVSHCKKTEKKYCIKNDFVSQLKEINILYKKTNGYNRYNEKLDILQLIAKKQNWITDLDEYSTKAMTVDEYSTYEENLLDENTSLKKEIEIMK